MAEIKCPMCSKMNPEEAEECRFCGAHLVSLSKKDIHPEKGEPADDLLASLRQSASVDPAVGQSDEETAMDDEQAAEGEIPDWLQRIRQMSEHEEETAANPDLNAPAEDDLPDWLKALAPEPQKDLAQQLETAADEPPALPSISSDETVFRSSEVGPAAEGGQKSEKEEPEDTLADWLGILDASRASEPEDSQADSSGTEKPAGSEEQGEAPAAKPEELPDWLRSMSQETESLAEKPSLPDQLAVELPAAEQPADEGKTAAEEDDLLAYLQSKDFEIQPETPPMSEPEKSYDFLGKKDQDVSAKEKPASEAVSEPTFEAPDDELSAWLLNLQAEFEKPEIEGPIPPAEIDRGTEPPSAREETHEFAKPSEQPEEMPDWSQLRGKAPGVVQEKRAEPLPDWIHTVSGEPGAVGEKNDTSIPPVEASAESAEAASVEAAEVAYAETAAAASYDMDELPAWLLDEEKSAAKPTDVEKEPRKGLEGEPASPVEAPTPEFQDTDAVDLSEWLGDLSPDERSAVFDLKESGAEEEARAGTPPFVGEDLGQWMPEKSIGEEKPVEQAAVEEPSSQVSNLPGEPLPDWLDEPEKASQPEKDLQPPLPAEKRKTGIQQAELPDWLEAMRPIDSVLPVKIEPMDDKKVEQSGPLAGLQAILPVQPAAAHYRKPPIYSVKLQVSEKQRAHAALLENMLEDEKRAVSVKHTKAEASYQLVRSIIGVILVVVVLLPLLGIPAAGVLVQPAASIDPFYDQVEAIPTGSPVLLAVEYAPGYSGEMRFAATGVIQRLMMREMRLAVLSTMPSGAVLAEGLKNAVIERVPELDERYSERDYFINLGYLAGETVSLQEFARSPKQAVQYGISSGLENRPVWDSAVLSDITQLSDFAAVILFTDTIENGRAWIEQVQPALNGVPFLVVSSAQATPLLQPYVQSGQVQGLLSGLAGGLTFEEKIKIPGSERGAYWLSNQFGLAAVVLVILVGALVEGILSMVGRSRSDEA